jgi:endonuclease/exonuclease/phosphatase family metal-dependent hydrolase
MPRYGHIRKETPDARRRVERLLSLRNLLRNKKRAEGGIPDRTLGKSLLLATWNIREFGRNQKYGPRLPEALDYIAEIISAFDIVALQEVNEDLTDLNALMKLLGPAWRYLLTDITVGHQGNYERMAFVYDGEKVRFEGLASQVVLPPEGRPARSPLQVARTPMMVGFRCNWFKFTICTVHIYYGKSVANDPRRVEEIDRVARHLAARARAEHAWAPTMILLGDFNIFKTTDETAEKLRDAGFHIPTQFEEHESGETGRHFDQIAFLSSKYEAQVAKATKSARTGVVKLFEKVFRDEDQAVYAEHIPKYDEQPSAEKKTKLYREWRTFQMSDHRPLWIELPADFSDQTLGKLLADLNGRGKKNVAEATKPRAKKAASKTASAKKKSKKKKSKKKKG